MRKLFIQIGGILLSLACTSAVQTTANDRAVGVIVPAYFFPGKLWDHLMAQKRAHPSVPLYLIANADSGPGTEKQAAYVKAIDAAQSAGIVVVGYIFTHYGKRPAADVNAEIQSWQNWYKVDGIFLDEMSDEPGKEAYYKSFTAALHRQHKFSIGNPGTTVAASYDDTVDIIMLHESPGYADGAASGLAPSHLAAINSNEPALDLKKLLAEKVGLVYPTDEKDPPTYTRLPKYFDELMTALEANDHG